MITSAAMAQALPQASVAALTGVLVFAAAVWVGGLVAIFVVARVASRTLRPAERVAFFPGLVVNLIAGTTTRTGLTVRAEHDTGSYPRGIKITDRQMRELERSQITRHDWHGEWNYCVNSANAA